MKFVINKEDFINSLSILVNVSSKKNLNIPILQNVKLEVNNGFLTMTTTDLDSTVKKSIQVNVEKNGATTVPAQTLFDIVKKMSEGSEILVEEKEDKSISVSSGRSKFKLLSLDPETFPIIEDINMDEECEISKDDLIDILDKTKFAISNDEARYYLNGIFIHSKVIDDTNYIVGVATDGHRLANVKKAKENIKISGYIIPKKTIAEIRKILDTCQDNVNLSFSKTKIKLSTKDCILISKLIDAEYPEYDRIIPSNNGNIATVNKKDFVNAIDRVSTVVSDKHKGVKFIVMNNAVKLIADSTENGSADDEVSANYTGNDIEIGFNSRYLLDILSQIESDEVYLKFNSGNNPALIQGTEEPNNLFVLMPVRI